MKMKNFCKYNVCVILISIFTLSCGKKKETPESERVGNEQVQKLAESEPDEVKVLTLRKSVFNKEILSNGRLEAVRKSDLRFQAQELIEEICVQNGDFVRKGQKIASLNKFKQQQQLVQSKDQLQLSRLNLEDVLIGQGYALADSAKMPKDLLRIAKVKSGYDRALSDLKSAEYNFHNLTLYAPFDGVIANLSDKVQNLPGGSTPFCTVIGNQEFEAQFKLLESELPSLKKGSKVTISPLSLNEEFMGIISAINPTIDEKGLVKVSARIKNQSQKLYDGMNVNVIVKEGIPSCFVVPKEAVVIRSGKKVAFVHENGRAIWKYVTVEMENSKEYALSSDAESVKEGDEVIYEGTINLAHDAPVKVIR